MNYYFEYIYGYVFWYKLFQIFDGFLVFSLSCRSYCLEYISVVFQLNYVLDSWIEYITRRKFVSTRESKVVGHYVAYKYMGDDRKLVRFDDAIVNTTDRLERYEVNLVFYRREDIEPIKTDMDLGFLLHLQPQVYGIRRALNPMPIHDNFNKNLLGAAPKNVMKPNNKVTVKSVDDETDKENLVGTQCVQKKDAVSTVPNASANTVTITSTQISNIITDALDLTLTSISNKDTDISMTAQLTEENDSQQELPRISQNTSNDNDKEMSGAESDATEPYNIEEGLNLDSENFVYPSEFDSSVNYSDIDDSTQDPIGNKTTDEASPSNYETENHEHDLHKGKIKKIRK